MKHQHTNTNIGRAALLFLALAWAMQSISPTTLAAPGIYREILYQGTLKNADGSNVNGPLDVTYRVYDAATGGNVLWTGTYTAANGNPVTVTNSSFLVSLGSGTGNAINLDFNDDSYYLGVTVGVDAEMTPRQRMGTAGYAFNADTVDGLHASNFVSGALASGNVLVGNASSIATGVAVSGDATLSNSGVLSIGDGVVTLAKIANGGDIVTSLTTPAGFSANGGYIANNVLTLSLADGTNPGLVSIGAQTLAGAKTFSTTPTFSSMTAGSVYFAGTGGALSQDNVNLFWDDTNNRLGIGDTTPAESLTVGSGGLFRINASGLALSAAGSAANPAFSFVADSDVGMFRAGANILGFTTNGTEQARITASGNMELSGAAAKTVGLGDAAFGAGNSLTMHGGGSGSGSNQTGGNLILASGDATGNGGSLVEIRTVKTNQGNGGANRSPTTIATFDGAGLGIGVSAPVYRLELPNTASSAGQGRANAWVTYSDETLKENILTLEDSLEKVLKLRGVSFTWKRSEVESFGFIAQEVEAVVPEIVSSGEDGLKSLEYGRLTPYLVNAIQEIVSIGDVFQDSLVRWFSDAANGIDDFFARRIVTDEICVKKSDSSRYCFTGDDLEAAIKTGNVYESPVAAESEPAI